MSDPDVSLRMRQDWNARAREDAGYYVAFGRRDQDDAGFFATAAEVIKGLEWELRRVPPAQRNAQGSNWRALEIGCGPGRLMRPMSAHFAHIYGVDVSDEMIALAKEKLRGTPHAHVHATDGASLALFPDDHFDFVYSYAVFQHIPTREVVTEYFREIRRVLKPGGFALLHINGLARGADATYDTWSGARFNVTEILDFTRENDFQVLALEGAATQYMWTTWRKHPFGWQAQQYDRTPQNNLRIRGINNANGSEPVAPSRGRFSSISIWVQNLPEDAGLHHLRVVIGDALGTVTYIGPPDNVGLQQINVLLPEMGDTGLLPVEIRWMDTVIAPPATLRVIPPGPSVPRVYSITDGVNLIAGTRIETRSVKLTLEEIARPHEIEASISGHPVEGLEFFCIDPRPQRFEVNFRLPEGVEPGKHSLELRIGRRKLAPIELDVVA
jgi:ubiquinone/menaquinone biosynthesis C-methylase UbiE